MKYNPLRSFCQTEHLAGYTEIDENEMGFWGGLLTSVAPVLVSTGGAIYAQQKQRDAAKKDAKTRLAEAAALLKAQQEAKATAIIKRSEQELAAKRLPKKEIPGWVWMGAAAIGGLGLVFYLKKK